MPKIVVSESASRNAQFAVGGWLGFALLCVVSLPSCGDREQKSAQKPGSTKQDASNGPKPGEEKPKAGPKPAQADPLLAIQATSRVRYHVAPDDPHQMQVTLAPPGHARFRLVAQPAKEGRRVLYHAVPGLAYETAERSAESQPLPDRASDAVHLWSHMRWTVYRWDQNAVWDPEPEDPEFARKPAPGGGTLRAHFPKGAALPDSLWAFDAEGQPVQGLEEIAWAEGADGPAVQSMIVSESQGKLWFEDEIKVRTGLRMQPEFFLPVDQREPTKGPVTTRPQTPGAQPARQGD